MYGSQIACQCVCSQTWGLAQSWFIPDYTNWSNVDFERAKAAVTAPLRNNTNHADYFTQTQSWHEQRQFVYSAVDSIRISKPALAAAIDDEFATLADVKPPSTNGFTKAFWLLGSSALAFATPLRPQAQFTTA